MMTLADRYLLYGWQTLKISLSLSAEPLLSPVTGKVHPEECPQIDAVCHPLVSLRNLAMKTNAHQSDTFGWTLTGPR